MTLKISRRSITGFKDYKTCLIWLLKNAHEDGRGQRTALATAIGCQPAYLTRVLNGDAHLSLEQIESAARYFMMSEAESEYLIALVGENRAGTESLKAYWRALLEGSREKCGELKGRLDLKDCLSESEILTYYGSWHFSAVHILTSIPSKQSVSSIGKYLSLSENTVRQALDFLVKAGLVEQTAGRFTITSRDIFLGRKNPMTARHHINWKLKSIESLNSPDPNALHYTGVITMASEDVQKMKELILRSIEKARALVQQSGEDILACYNFEFFEVGGRP